MIVLFDCNSYDELINLSPKDLQKIMDRVDKVILPQAVRNQLDMIIGHQDKMEKLSKINQVIADFDIAGKIEHIGAMFGFVDSDEQSYFDSLPDKMKNGDKQIALTAKLEGAVMITDDKNFLNGLKLINQPVLSFEDFKKFLN